MLQKCCNLLTNIINNDRIGEQDVTKPVGYVLIIKEGFMHNLMSFNQLASWKEIEMSQQDDRELVNDYFNCLIECEDDQSSCKTICKDILM